MTRALALMLALAAPACGTAGAPATAPEPPPPAGPAANRCPGPSAGVSVGGQTGSGEDAAATPVRRLVLMGGGSEHDSASTRFVEAAGGGDVVILRASGSLTSYPNYFAGTLRPVLAPASVVTVLTTNPVAAGEGATLCWLGRAEAVWLAGGDQWDYLGRWPGSVHDALAALAARGGAIGGTSAGAVSLGEAAFAAELGSVTSEAALADPLGPAVSLRYPSFAAPELAGVLVDSHFMNRDREGRLLAFLARFLHDRPRAAVVGIGLDEGVALEIETGRFRVSAGDAGAAWAYRVEGPAMLRPGAPLSLATVRRVRLEHGSAGAWPLDFDALHGVTLRVEDGRVTRASAQPSHRPAGGGDPDPSTEPRGTR